MIHFHRHPHPPQNASYPAPLPTTTVPPPWWGPQHGIHSALPTLTPGNDYPNFSELRWGVKEADARQFALTAARAPEPSKSFMATGWFPDFKKIRDSYLRTVGAVAAGPDGGDRYDLADS